MAIAVTAFAVAGCASGYRALAPSASVTTTSPAGEHWFRVQWEVHPDGPSTRRIEGYVYNSYGRPAENIRMLVQALDASGAVIDQRLAWVPGGVPQLSRAYFEVPRLPIADHYRVTVWGFDFRRVGSRSRPPGTLRDSGAKSGGCGAGAEYVG